MQREGERDFKLNLYHVTYYQSGNHIKKRFKHSKALEILIVDKISELLICSLKRKSKLSLLINYFVYVQLQISCPH